jgi:hypothetical protein
MIRRYRSRVNMLDSLRLPGKCVTEIMKKAEAALAGASYWARVADRNGPPGSADAQANLQEVNHSTIVLLAGYQVDLMLSGNLNVAAGSPEDARRLVADAELTTTLVIYGQRFLLKAHPIDLDELRIKEPNGSYNPLATIEGCKWHYQYSPQKRNIEQMSRSANVPISRSERTQIRSL